MSNTVEKRFWFSQRKVATV